MRENLVLKFPEAGDRFLHYQTDTTPGSSGSPVYNDQWELVALHHSGYPRRNPSGKILTPEGDEWKVGMGEHRIDWIANEGIRVAAIVEHLKSLGGMDSAQQELLRPAIAPPSTGTATGPASSRGAGTGAAAPRPREGGAGAPPPQPALAPSLSPRAAAQVVVTIPIHVSVKVGDPIFPTVSAPGMKVSQPAAPPPAGARSSIDDETVRAARAELERSRTKRYLDEVAESLARSTYYRGLAPGSDPRQFFTSLSRLLESTHANQPAYAPIRHLYPWIDLQSTRRITSIYSGQDFDPMELIEADRQVEQERAARLEAFRVTEAAASPEELAMQESLLEASLPFNCEHCVPQSWFGKKEPMRGDLHHLFACESGCNSFRGNMPYFDFRVAEEVVRAGCGRREMNRFQPTAGMGIVARATLYFLLRYPGIVQSGPTTYTKDRIDMLLGWHHEHEVTIYERHRNQAIYEVQGNRNPLIDHADWSDKIDFIMGLG